MSSVIMSAKNLCFSYGGEPFMQNVSLDIKSGELAAVVGKNGSGKSTLFALLNGALKPHSGTVEYMGKPISAIKDRERAKEIAVIYQSTQCRFPFSCYETVEMGLFPHNGRFARVSDEDRKRIEDIMEKTDTLRFSERCITELSGGEVQRVLLARALVQRPKLLFLDEAMSGLDIAARLVMTKLLRQLCREEGLAVVYIRHDIAEAFSSSDRIIALDNGRIAADGAPSELLTERFFADVFSVRAKISGSTFSITDTV